jgi:hypothetical protein
MNITSIEELCKCRSYAVEDRCRFFKEMPPLKPGFKPNPEDPELRPDGKHHEVEPPDRLANLRRGAHYVYKVEGEGVDEYEHACVGVFMVGAGDKQQPVPYAWFSQSDTFIQGEEALERIGLPVENDLLTNYADALNGIDGAVQEYIRVWPNHRLAFGFDDGTGLKVFGNDTPMMRALLDSEKAAQDKSN